MPHRALTFEPQRAAVLAEARGSGRIDAFGQVELFRRSVARADGGQHALRRKRHFAQANANRVVDGIRNRRDGRRANPR